MLKSRCCRSYVAGTPHRLGSRLPRIGRVAGRFRFTGTEAAAGSPLLQHCECISHIQTSFTASVSHLGG